MNPILSNSDQGAPSYLKVRFIGFKEFGSGDGPLPQSPGFFLFSILSSTDRTTLHLQDVKVTAPHTVTTRTQIIVALNSLKPQTLLIPTHKMYSFPFSSVCCSHDQVGDLNCCQASWPLKTNITEGKKGYGKFFCHKIWIYISQCSSVYIKHFLEKQGYNYQTGNICSWLCMSFTSVIMLVLFVTDFIILC